tara:strand:+ start:3611 stop:5701 length:2091 start_codon:yes stop_codon:yes gene_type:complete
MEDNFLQPADDESVQINNPEEQMPGLAGHINGLFKSSEDGRYQHEQTWLQAFKNFRGIYDSTTQYRESEKSRVFIKITKTKVLASYGQLVDILFSNKKFPIVIEPTPIPEGIADTAHLKTPLDEVIDPYGYEGDGRQVPSGMSDPDALGEKYKNLPLEEGPSKAGEPQVTPAKESALNMEKLVHDQLTDTNAVTVFRNAIFESAMLGTGIIKGPFNHYKRIHKWTKDEEGRKVYEPYEKIVPKLEHVSIWDFHPDPAATSMSDCEYVIERHRFTRQQLRALVNKPHFDASAIEDAIAKGPNYTDKYYEDTIRDEDNQASYNQSRYEVLEYWGVLDGYMAKQVGLDVGEISDLDQVQINAWICGSSVLRCVLNPFTPARIPYCAFPYEVNPYQLWGIGVAENMEDAQMLMNGHIRMAIDNLALAGNLVFDVDEASLVPGQNMDIFPGKIFRRQSGVTGTAINGLKFPNTAGENLQMYQISRQLADEETGLPSIMHGQTGVSGTGRTAAGLSMLLGGASLSIKTVIKNIDDYLLKPIGEAYFQWNMQFNETSPEIVGDLEIKPNGSTGVMQKEVRSQRLTALLQTVANPLLAPFIKLPALMKELAVAQDIDPDKLVNDVNEAQIYAQMLQGLANAQQGTSPNNSPTNQQPQNVGGAGSVPNNAQGAGGGGNDGGSIGVGASPTAGETGFTGNAPQVEE